MAFNVVGPGFFANAGIPLIAGREFSDEDRSADLPVAVVNRAMARKYFRGQNPVDALRHE